MATAYDKVRAEALTGTERTRTCRLHM